MLDQIDLIAEREAAAALRLRRLTGADEARDISVLGLCTRNAGGSRAADTGTGYQMGRLNDGSAYRQQRKPDALRAFDRIQAQFAGRRVVVRSGRADIVTSADRARREANRELRAAQLEYGRRLQLLGTDRAAARALLTQQAG